MSSTNDITGDSIRTKNVTEKFRSNYDAIDWGNKPRTIADLVSKSSTDPTPEIKEALEKLSVLEASLREVRRTLLEWDRVSKQMLYPHQHNTAQMNKEALEILEQAINGIKR